MLTEIGGRLKEERDRVGLKQPALAALGGVSKTSQVNYETGKRAPDALYLAAVAAAGVDVQYVVTGVSSATGPEDAEFLRAYRNSQPEMRAAALRVLGVAAVPPPEPPPGVAISGGTQGQVVAGDSRQGKVTVNVGRQKRGAGK